MRKDNNSPRMDRRTLLGWALVVAIGASIPMAYWKCFRKSGLMCEAMDDIYGLSLFEVENRMIKTDYLEKSQIKYFMRDRKGEISVPLLNIYPPSNPRSANILIIESTWRYRDYSVTVWFHVVNGVWRVVDAIKYGNDVNF